MKSKPSPVIRMQGFNNEWQQVKLSDKKDVRDGTHDSPKYHIEGFPLITSKNLKEQGLDFSDVSFITKEDFDQINKRSKVSVDDILFGMIGTIGNPVLVETEGFAIKNVALIKNGGEIENIFLINLLKSPIFEEYIRGENAGNTQKFLSLSKIRNFEFYIPIVPEQIQIGYFFKKINEIINIYQQELETLKQTKQGFLQKMFPKEGETLPEIRFNGYTQFWKKEEIGKVFDTITDYVANGSFQSLRENVNSYESENYAYLVRLQDASNQWRGPWLYTDEESYSFLKKTALNPNDIIMSNVGSVGKFFLVPNLDRPMTLAPNAMLIRSSINDNHFIYQMMLTKNMQAKILEKTTPGVQSKINKTDFKKIETYIPHIDEQIKIGKFFRQLDEVIELHEKELEALKETKKAFLQKMFV